MKIPLTDLGSNTVRMSVYEAEGSRFRPLFSEKRMAGLASYVEEGLLSAEGINRACQVLKEFQWLLEQLHLPAMAVFATASLRNIGNTAEAVAVIRQRTGLEVDVISGELEARITRDGKVYRREYTPEGTVLEVNMDRRRLHLVEGYVIPLESGEEREKNSCSRSWE